MSGLNQVGLFLALAKEYVQESGVILVPREQNRDYMASRGMSMRDLESVILALEESDCLSGPEDDRDERRKDWTIAIFSPEYEGEKLYLKISVRTDARRCKCLSVKLYVDRT
mgnify:CR=1 FL=1